MSDHSTGLANPSPLGLFGLAMVTLVASSQKLGITDGTSLVIPWAIFLGASAQLYASIVDSKLNNTFGATVFGAYAFFWYAVGFIWLIQNGVFGEQLQAAADPKQIAFAYLGYLIFTFYMTIAALNTNTLLFVIMVLVNFLFIGLMFSAFGIMEHSMHILAAYSEVAISIASFYGSAATALNTQFGKTVLPVGKKLLVLK